MKALFSFIHMVLLLSSATAQIEDLTHDREFFEKQKMEYQRWLNHAGIGSTLQVYAIEVEPQRLSLYLAFPYEDLDSIMVAWQKLKTTFEKERPITLEQELFYKMVHMMEIRQSLANIQIHDTYDMRLEPLFSRSIYFEGNNVKVETSDPKSKIRELIIQPQDMSGLKKMSAETFQKQFNRQTVYDKIQQYAKQKYERKYCDQRYPKFRLLEHGDVLRFEITDLCREVLVDEANPLLCQVLSNFGYGCNWIKRELLTFKVVHREAPGGFGLYIEIDGKYGSGFYETVRRGGYLNMEIDFDDYLERYADQLKEEFKTILKQ